MSDHNDHQLLAEFSRTESDAAFAALVARYVNLVYSTAFRFTGNTHQAEEITQAVFIILARKAEKLSPRVVLSGWLYQVARLTSANLMKREIRRQHREQEVYMQSALNEPNDRAWQGIAPLLDEAMGRLCQTDRDAVVLRFFENKSSAEIGAALRMNEETARKRVNRALEKLRKFFTKRGVSSTTAIIAGAISANSVQAAPLTLAKVVTASAIVKGVAAKGSTLTLIKGALKIMAWTKAKTAIVAVVAIVLAAGTTHVVIKEIRGSGSGPRTTPATESIKGQLVGRAELVDAGNTTPEAAWESRYWARAKGDYDAVIAATEPPAVPTAKAWMGDKATFRARSQAEFASFKGLQILARKDLAIDRVELKYQFPFRDGPASPETKIVEMVRVNGAWRCAQTRAYDASWDDGSQPEPQP